MEWTEVLLENWEGWDGNGISDIPGKDVTLTNGVKGCILINEDGICAYDETLANIGVTRDEGDCFLAFAEHVDDTDTDLKGFLSEEDFNESFVILARYLEYNKRYLR